MSEPHLESPIWENGRIIGAVSRSCSIHGVPATDKGTCCVSAVRVERRFSEVGTEIGGCTVTYDADEARVAKALLTGNAFEYMKFVGTERFLELQDRVMKKFNTAVVRQAERR